MSNSKKGKGLVKWAVIAAAVVGAGAWFFGGSGNDGDSKKLEASVTVPVTIGTFLQEVVESGEVESSSNVEIRCEVDTKSTGVTILEIVPEGTYVEEGDFLVRLDDAELKEKLVIREIDSNSSRATLAQAKADLKSAELELKEYQSGLFREQEEQLKSEEFVAKENLRRAQEYLGYSQRLSEKGYVSEVQLEADRFAVDKAGKELEVANTKLEVLQDFTREKILTQMQANIETSRAKLSAAERSYKIDLEQAEELKVQMAMCEIAAPTSGQVVYSTKRTSTGEPLIEEGKTVVERQEIIRLPDPKRMQVAAGVNESRIEMLEVGMDVKVRIDALPDVELEGELVDVTEYPLPRKNSYVAHIKNYGATIVIKDPPTSLRPGMTAEVAILVQERPEATQVPVQAVFEREKRYFCLVSSDVVAMKAREIEIGASNEQYVLVEAGLEKDEVVVLSPETYADEVELPDPAELVQWKKAKSQKNLAAR